MHKLLILFSLHLVPVLSFAAMQKNCFSNHLREAISANKKNLQLYSEMTDGRSDKIFNKLIRSEKALVLPARFYDYRARRFNDAGVRLFCDDFLPMSLAKGFKLHHRKVLNYSYSSFDWRPYEAGLLAAVDAGDIYKIQSISEKALGELSKEPEYHCMMRHVFESVHRMAHLLPEHILEAEKLGLDSPKNLSLAVIRHHLRTFNFSSKLDGWSAPIQASGIPVLCADLPN